MRHKILFISSWFPSKIEPTNGNFVQRHAEAVALLHDVEILHAIGDAQQKETYVFDEKYINGIKTLIVYYKNTNNPLVNFYRRINAYLHGFSKMQKPDLVHANILHNSMFFAVYLKRKLGIPFIVSEHWSALKIEHKHQTSSVIRWTAKMIGNAAEKVMPVSENLQLGLIDLGIQKEMTVIPNVVDTHLFHPKSKTSEIFTFIHVSNLTKNKNPDAILRVAAKLLKKGHQFNLQIGGDGDTSSLEEFVQKERLQKQVTVFGIQTLDQIAERMQSADCFILFSKFENQPCVIAESFASGLKVISTKVGGIPEFFPPNFGVLLEQQDENLLENAMIQVISEGKNTQPAIFKEYAEKTFSKEVIAKRFSEIYNEILA